MGQALKALVNTLNATINSLNESDFKVYDEENPDYYISKVGYDEESDQILFATEKEEEH